MHLFVSLILTLLLLKANAKPNHKPNLIIAALFAGNDNVELSEEEEEARNAINNLY